MSDSLHPDSAAAKGNGNSQGAANMTQRARWATRRLTVRSGGSKRKDLADRTQQNQNAEGEKGDEGPENEPEGPSGADDEDQTPNRSLYFNIPLPEDMVDEEGNPIHNYPRNKIRTAKYTPLSFIPKNLWFQFHNIANIFFLFLVILVVSESRVGRCAAVSQELNGFITVFPHLRW